MEWNLKAPPSWDFTELEQGPFSNLDSINGSAGFRDHHRPGGEDFSVDLKLGRVGHSGNEPVSAWKDTGIAKTPASLTSGSSKRSRGSYNGSQPVSCLVDGCNADLSGCRDYHRRHKVCEAHSKTPQVTIGGHMQRFCQQCSRFHGLEEFDEGKRSCRKRLDGHNRRRRKPQPEPFSRYGTLLSSYRANHLQPFSSSLVYPATAAENPSWVGGSAVKTEPDSGLHNSHYPPLFLNPSPKSFPLFQPEEQPIPKPFPLACPDRSFYGKLSTATRQVQSSEHHALYLLSSSETGLGHHNGTNEDVLRQLGSVPAVHSSGLGQMGSGSVANGGESGCPGMFHHMGSGVDGGQESNQTPTSHWR